jgi:hypothetical protein
MMGNAKRRGTFEERKAAAITRQKVEAELQKAKRAEIEASQTPEQKSMRHRDAMTLMIMLGMMGAYNFPAIVYEDKQHNFKPRYRR